MHNNQFFLLLRQHQALFCMVRYDDLDAETCLGARVKVALIFWSVTHPVFPYWEPNGAMEHKGVSVAKYFIK